MMKWVLLWATLLSPACYAEAPIALRVDTEFANAVLDELCGDQSIDETAIRQSVTAKDMVAHFAQFRADFTMDAYVHARQLAARCEAAERDIFRFAEVIANREALRRQVEQIKRIEDQYSSAIGAMLADYTPDGLQFQGSATLVIGSPSCGGWAKDTAFYVDLPCIKGDAEGLRYLIAHESYHAVQSLFMAKPAQSEPLAMIFDAILREGSATRVADFDQIEAPGAYAQLSQRITRTNQRRLSANFDLLNIAAHYLHSSADSNAAQMVDTIGLSGMYDSPFYSVGATMVQAIDKQLGRAAMLCLLASPAQEFFLRYAELEGKQDRPQLGAWVLQGARALRSEASRAQADDCVTDR